MNTKTNKKIMSIAVEVIVVVISIAGILLLTKMRAMAAGTGKNLQIGAGALNNNVNTTSAPTVYYDSNADEWRVIGYDGTGVAGTSGTMTLIANGILDDAQYDDDYYSLSILRDAIGTIEGRLSTPEASAVAARTLEGGGGNVQDANYDNNKIKGESISNAIMWPLSVSEANSMNSDLRNVSHKWWLRTPGRFLMPALVLESGEVEWLGEDVLWQYGVRPAFNLNLSSILFTSAAVGGKASGTVGADLTLVGASNASTEWKLTVADSARSGFTASRTDLDTLTPGGTAEISYSGAQTGTNEYVSAIITDSSDTVLYYGNIASCTSDTGTASINIPVAAPADSKLYVFQEKCNGNYMTDYSSGLINLTAPGSSGVGAVAATPTQTSEETPEESEDIPEFNYLDPLEDLLDYAISLGGERTVYWREGTALPSNIMKTLEENPQLTLVFSYTYEYKDYEVTIPGKKVKTDPKIPWYGPLYLYSHYGK